MQKTTYKNTHPFLYGNIKYDSTNSLAHIDDLSCSLACSIDCFALSSCICSSLSAIASNILTCVAFCLPSSNEWRTSGEIIYHMSCSCKCMHDMHVQLQKTMNCANASVNKSNVIGGHKLHILLQFSNYNCSACLLARWFNLIFYESISIDSTKYHLSDLCTTHTHT